MNSLDASADARAADLRKGKGRFDEGALRARAKRLAEAETRYTTRPIAGVPANLPMVIFSDAENVYIREERGGMLFDAALFALERNDWPMQKLSWRADLTSVHWSEVIRCLRTIPVH